MSSISDCSSCAIPAESAGAHLSSQLSCDQLCQAQYLSDFRRDGAQLRLKSEQLQRRLVVQLEQISQLGASNLALLQKNRAKHRGWPGQVGEFQSEKELADTITLQIKQLQDAGASQQNSTRKLFTHWTQLNAQLNRQAAKEVALVQRARLQNLQMRGQFNRWANLPPELIWRIVRGEGSDRASSALVAACRLTCAQWYCAIRDHLEVLAPHKTPYALGFAFPNLRELDLSECADLHLTHLDFSLPQQLRSLNWCAFLAGDAGLQKIAQLEQLRYLRVISGEISSEGVELLGRLRHLTALQLPGSENLRGAALCAIAHLPHLRNLELNGSSLAEMEYLHLLSAPQLTALKIHNSWSLTNQSAFAIGSLQKLEQLHLQLSSIGDVGVLQIGSLISLRELCLKDCAYLTIAGAIHLCALSHLTALELFAPNLSDQMANNLLFLPKLQRLSLQPANSLSGTGFRMLGALRRLTQLNLHSTRSVVLGERLEYLRELTNLAQLRLTFWIVLPIELASALSALPSLRVLDLTNCTLSNETHLSALAAVTQLENLTLSQTYITNAALIALQNMGNLRSLNISGCMRITRVGLRALSALSRLRRLDLRGCGLRRIAASRLFRNEALSIAI